MKHFSLKIILLALLCAMFVGGAVYAIYFPANNIQLSDDDIDAVVKSLLQKGIKIDAEAIPRRTKSMSTAVMRGEFERVSDVADLLLKDGYTEKSGQCYTDDVTIKLDPVISIKCNPSAFSDEFKNVFSGNVVKKIKNITKKYLDETGDVIMEIYEGDGSRLNVLMTRTYKSYPVFNDSLLFGLSENGISSVTGLWYKAESENKGKKLPKSPVHALLTFADDKNNYETNIVSITQGYRLDTDAQNSDSVSLVPTWRILTENGEIHYIDS